MNAPAGDGQHPVPVGYAAAVRMANESRLVFVYAPAGAPPRDHYPRGYARRDEYPPNTHGLAVRWTVPLSLSEREAVAERLEEYVIAWGRWAVRTGP